MAINLSKGGKISLDKVATDAGIAGGIGKMLIGLGWDTNKYDGGEKFDLDASIFLISASGKVEKETDFVYYKHLEEPGVIHTGDNRTGDGDGDDEVIKVDLSALRPGIERIAITVTIDQADVRKQNFGMVNNAYIHIEDEVTTTELLRYDLGEDYSVETAIVVAEMYKHNGEWKFNAVGSGFAGGLPALCQNYGLDV